VPLESVPPGRAPLSRREALASPTWAPGVGVAVVRRGLPQGVLDGNDTPRIQTDNPRVSAAVCGIRVTGPTPLCAPRRRRPSLRTDASRCPWLRGNETKRVVRSIVGTRAFAFKPPHGANPRRSHCSVYGPLGAFTAHRIARTEEPRRRGRRK